MQRPQYFSRPEAHTVEYPVEALHSSSSRVTDIFLLVDFFVGTMQFGKTALVLIYKVTVRRNPCWQWRSISVVSQKARSFRDGWSKTASKLSLSCVLCNCAPACSEIPEDSHNSTLQLQEPNLWGLLNAQPGVSDWSTANLHGIAFPLFDIIALTALKRLSRP